MGRGRGANRRTRGVDPRYLFAIYPVEKARITGNWEVMGLQATASYDYTLEDVFVPATATSTCST